MAPNNFQQSPAASYSPASTAPQREPQRGQQFKRKASSATPVNCPSLPTPNRPPASEAKSLRSLVSLAIWTLEFLPVTKPVAQPPTAVADQHAPHSIVMQADSFPAARKPDCARENRVSTADGKKSGKGSHKRTASEADDQATATLDGKKASKTQETAHTHLRAPKRRAISKLIDKVSDIPVDLDANINGPDKKQVGENTHNTQAAPRCPGASRPSTPAPTSDSPTLSTLMPATPAPKALPSTPKCPATPPRQLAVRADHPCEPIGLNLMGSSGVTPTRPRRRVSSTTPNSVDDGQSNQIDHKQGLDDTPSPSVRRSRKPRV